MTVPRVVLVAFESAQILDVTGPLEVFSTASRFVPGVDYDLSVAGVGGGMLASSSGLSFSTVDLSNCRSPIDTLIVTAGRDMDATPPTCACCRRCAGWPTAPEG